MFTTATFGACLLFVCVVCVVAAMGHILEVLSDLRDEREQREFVFPYLTKIPEDVQ